MDDRKVMLLTGASRGIGHATVKRFAAEGWRVITCSRQPFPEQCPWGGGREDHIQLDLADPADTINAVEVIRERLEGGKLHALVNNAGISPKAEDGGRLNTLDTDLMTWGHVFSRQFLLLHRAGARLGRGAVGGQRRGGQCDLDCGVARASVRGGRPIRHRKPRSRR